MIVSIDKTIVQIYNVELKLTSYNTHYEIEIRRIYQK